ncbi:hypothetical protein SY83_03355 [Paenibacillus swuensis]|uniref:Uncharacterized protein n=1 Tax=Paenibacillus swuensis TaxID=1178515 RepID=A0A172TEP8_9BACL|nr:hypothetical protein [Paenibacillus swuensis]ANE45511.1 hypothetical protein SY83_03355 [Paenibacillus swuensis]
MRFPRAWIGYRREEVHQYLHFLRLEQEMIQNHTAKESILFQEEMNTKTNEAKQLRAELREILALERTYIEGTKSS